MLSCDDSLGPHGQRMGFPRQEYWSGLPFPLPGHLPNPGIEPVSLASSSLAGGFLTTSAPWGLEGTDPKVRDREFPGTVIKNLLANAGDTGDASLIPGSGRSPGGGNDNPLQYSVLAWKIL